MAARVAARANRSAMTFVLCVVRLTVICSKNNLPGFSASKNCMNSLPLIQAHDICQDWLNLVEVIKLDSSFCNSRNRKWFHSVLGTLTESPRWEAKQYMGSVRAGDFYIWINSRNIRLVNIIFGEGNFSHDVFNLVDKSRVNCVVATSTKFYSEVDEANKLCEVINTCPRLENIHFSAKYSQFDMDDIFSNISNEILKSLRNICIKVRDEEDYSIMVDIIENNCGNLINLTLNLQINIEDIKAIINNNPLLIDLSFTPFLSCDYNNYRSKPYIRIKSFLLHLMTNVSNKFRKLCVNKVKVLLEDSLEDVIHQFIVHYKDSLVHLKLPNMLEFHDYLKSSDKKERKLVLFQGLFDKKYPIESVVALLPDITSLYIRFDFFANYESDTMSLVDSAVTLYCKTLTFLHLKSFFVWDNSYILSGWCPLLKCIQLESDRILEHDIFVQLQQSNIEIKLLSSKEKYRKIEYYGSGIPVEEWEVDID